MNCERARSLIDAYSTDELDLDAAFDVEGHLKDCAACAKELQSIRSLRRLIDGPSLRYLAPPELRQQVAAELHPSVAAISPVRRRRISRPAMTALAAGFGMLLLLPWAALYWNASRSSANQLVADITASHIRSLMGDHLLDVPSTDQHTVKPWFNGKLDFSPTVVDLTPEGFPLIGGRLDYLNNRPVAAIVYQRHKHLINVFTWPSTGAGESPVALSQHNGYNLLAWKHNGMNWVAVSDLNAQELSNFAELLRPSATTRP